VQETILNNREFEVKVAEDVEMMETMEDKSDLEKAEIKGKEEEIKIMGMVEYVTTKANVLEIKGTGEIEIKDKAIETAIKVVGQEIKDNNR